MHKQIAESRNLNQRIAEMVVYLHSIESDDHVVVKKATKVRKNNHCKWDRSAMVAWVRKLEEKAHRASTRAQVRRAALNLDDDVIVKPLMKYHRAWW